jgi:phenolic acid decarboxylase
MNILESILAAREFYVKNAQASITKAKSGLIFVNDLPSYIKRQEETICNFTSGIYDHTFTMQQRAHYIRTGAEVALLG